MSTIKNTFNNIQFPLAKKAAAHTIANNLVSVQSLSSPTGIFYIGKKDEMDLFHRIIDYFSKKENDSNYLLALKTLDALNRLDNFTSDRGQDRYIYRPKDRLKQGSSIFRWMIVASETLEEKNKLKSVMASCGYTVTESPTKSYILLIDEQFKTISFMREAEVKEINDDFILVQYERFVEYMEQ